MHKAEVESNVGTHERMYHIKASGHYYYIRYKLELAPEAANFILNFRLLIGMQSSARD